MKPSIVVAAYNRPNTLRRLLSSISRANFSDHRDVQLIISIDRSTNKDVYQLAESFAWQHGSKSIFDHSRHLGLKQHILFCGELSIVHGSIVLLEDDVVVSPHFYDYACQAVTFYSSDERIAGISLYSYRYNEFAKRNFLAIDDGYDNYFLQLAVSWGQMWTSRHWQRFKSYFSSDHFGKRRIDAPEKVMGWPDSSWKRDFTLYMVAEQLYFVIPRIALATNFADMGTHIRSDTPKFQVPLLMSPREFVFSELDRSNSIYDAYHEISSSCIRRWNAELNAYDFECDFYGTKNLSRLRSEYVITSRSLPETVKSYKGDMTPHELNVIFDIEGNDIHLVKTPRQDVSLIQGTED